MKKGIKSVTGNIAPEVGEANDYEVSSYHPGTSLKNEDDIKWKLYVQERNKNWRELRGPLKTGKKATFLLPEKWLGKTLMVEAYIYNPEKKESPGLIITPVSNKTPKINKVELFYADNKKGSTFSFMETLRAKAFCVSMFLEEVVFTLWEDDAKGSGHNKNNQPIATQKATVDINGMAVAEFMLTQALMRKAMQGEFDVKELEFYVTVEYYKDKKHASENVNVSPAFPPINGEILPKPTDIPKAKDSPADSKFPSRKEEKEILEGVVDKSKELWDWSEISGIIKKEKEPTRPEQEKTKSPSGVGKEPRLKLDEETICKCCRIDEEIFFINYEKEFPRRDKRGNLLPMRESLKESLKKVFRGIRQYYSKEERDCDVRKIAYMLATAKHETANTFNPIKEYGDRRYFEGMYDPVLGKNEKRRKMALENENTQQGDGVKYCGKGFVQITWKKNYRKMGEKFGVDLVDSPEKALLHDLAIKIMIYGSEEGIFTGKALGDYINSKGTDYYNARRVINGTDDATTIQGYAEKFEKILKIKKCKD